MKPDYSARKRGMPTMSIEERLKSNMKVNPVLSRAAEGGMSMGVYINMEMPRTMSILAVFPNGYVAVYDSKDTFIGEATAVPVPEHGRLIDKDALEQDISDSVVFSGRDQNAELIGAKKIINRLHCAPIIIPADKEEKE